MLLGARPLNPARLADYLLGRNLTSMEEAVIEQRGVRTLWAGSIGAALALAGTGMQGITRNPLGDPGILGINAGEAFAVVAGITFLGAASPSSYASLALLGAGGAAVLVYCLAALGPAGATPIKLALIGSAISAGLGSLTSAFILHQDAALDALRTWQIGSVAASSMTDYLPAGLLMLAGAAILLLEARTINNFALGDDIAAALGENLTYKRSLILVGVALLCGSATSMAGPIAFVGLMVPHMLRSLSGPDYRHLIRLAGPLGGSLLILGDSLGRIVLPPEEIPVGVSMIMLGVPMFIYLVRQQRAVDL